MISFEEAYSIVINNSSATTIERVPINHSLQRVLAEDIIADMDMPPFDKSAVDGYACRREDINSNLKVIEVIKAGSMPEKEITKTFCSKIMTGGVIPKGANCVLMVEDTKIIDNENIQFVKENTANNICIKGEDICKGKCLISKGTLINPFHIAVMAAMGYTMPFVSKLPNVAIIATGEEIVEPHLIPTDAQIRNSNASQLIAQMNAIGINANYAGIVTDNYSSLSNSINQQLSQSDIILITGGVSMGDFDLVPKVLEDLGVKVLFHNISVQPGKPTLFGIKDKTLVFGLPGNPVSTYIQSELLVKSAIYKMMGATNPEKKSIKLTLGKTYIRKKSERLGLIPVKILNAEVFPIEYHGSAHINAMTEADGLISIPIGTSIINKGEHIDVRLF